VGWFTVPLQNYRLRATVTNRNARIELARDNGASGQSRDGVMAPSAIGSELEAALAIRG